jgi:hypothetical protein
MVPHSRRRFLGLLASHAGMIGTTGCGTILHPERRGQPAGPLDWGIVALDAIGLLLFFVPGVIAFAVDFSNGTIYLPADRYGLRSGTSQGSRLVTIHAPQKRLTIPALETIVSRHSGEAIHLKPGTYRTVELENLDEFWPEMEKLSAP